MRSPYAGRDGVKETRDRFARLQEGERLTPGMHVALLPQGDQLFNVRAHSLGLGDGRVDAVLKNDGGNQIPQ